MKKKHLVLIFIIWLIILLKITVVRSNFGMEHLFVNGKLNLIPLKSLFGVLTNYGLWRFTYLFIGNIIWFLPFGFLMPYLTKRSGRKIILLALILSLSIEVLQFIFGTGFSEIDDLMLNTFGAYLGLLLSCGLRRKRESY